LQPPRAIGMTGDPILTRLGRQSRAATVFKFTQDACRCTEKRAKGFELMRLVDWRNL
jgi:hypothetical protein